MQITFQSITENQEKSKITQDILADLPMWFGIQSAMEEYAENVKNYQFIKVSADSIPVGFISIKSNNSFTAEICSRLTVGKPSRNSSIERPPPNNQLKFESAHEFPQKRVFRPLFPLRL